MLMAYGLWVRVYGLGLGSCSWFNGFVTTQHTLLLTNGNAAVCGCRLPQRETPDHQRIPSGKCQMVNQIWTSMLCHTQVNYCMPILNFATCWLKDHIKTT